MYRVYGKTRGKKLKVINYCNLITPGNLHILYSGERDCNNTGANILMGGKRKLNIIQKIKII